MNKIYMMGARPAVSYGSAVQGMSDAELHKVRQTLLQGTTPRMGCLDAIAVGSMGRSSLGAGIGTSTDVGQPPLEGKLCKHSELSAGHSQRVEGALVWCGAGE